MTDQPEQFTYTDADGDVLNIAPVQDDDGTDMVWLSTKTTDGVHVPPADVERVVAAIRTAAGQPEPAVCPGVETEPNACSCSCEGCSHHCTAHQPATDRAALAETVAQAIRDAACTDGCDKTEEVCGRERIQPVLWRRGKLDVVEGTPEQLTDAVLSVLPAPGDRATVHDAERGFRTPVEVLAVHPGGENPYAEVLVSGWSLTRPVHLPLSRLEQDLGASAGSLPPGTWLRAEVNCYARRAEDLRFTHITLAPPVSEDLITEVRQPEPEAPSVDVDPVYDPRAWETYRRDAGCGCTAPAPVACKVPHGTGAWLCVCHRLSGPTWKDSDPSQPLSQADEKIRQFFQEPNRCTSADGMFRCARPTGHLGDHRMGRTFWSRRPDDDASAVPASPEATTVIGAEKRTCGATTPHPSHRFMRMEVVFQCPGVPETEADHA
ncbi:hypothetical protein ACIOEX_01345 [Streptomyces sp. NPDC087850]|uniref:hypothetical protein n=1 Tax=Streptomyces sp. NPDC087850 TaxID=3365809 RepID=UPI003819FEA3